MAKQGNQISSFFTQGTLKPVCLVLLLGFLSLIGKTQDAFINDSVAIVSGEQRPPLLIKKIDLSQLDYYRAINNRVNFGLTGCEYHYIILKIDAPETCYE